MGMRSSIASVSAGAVLALLAVCIPLVSSAQVAVSINIAPPALPMYEQPPLPAPGYIWTPGYWAYGPDGYFWVPGTWVEPPAVGLLWTPGYWGWNNGLFVWTAGYWATEVGFYGGVNYGFGYPGSGYAGGYWRGHDFYYNRVVNNVTNVQVRNVYTQNVTNVTVNRVSYVGGPGGLTARPTPQEQQAMHGAHSGPTAAQNQQREGASSRRDLLASVNHGKPQIAATPRAGEFSAPSAPAVSTAGNAHQAPAKTAAAHPAAPTHASELPKPPAAPAPAASASAAERAAAQQQAQLQARQEQERATLERQQSQDHAKYSQQKSPDNQAYAAMERQHQQQTQALQQRQSQERQAAEKPGQQARTVHQSRAPAPGG